MSFALAKDDMVALVPPRVRAGDETSVIVENTGRKISAAK